MKREGQQLPRGRGESDAYMNSLHDDSVDQSDGNDSHENGRGTVTDDDHHSSYDGEASEDVVEDSNQDLRNEEKAKAGFSVGSSTQEDSITNLIYDVDVSREEIENPEGWSGSATRRKGEEKERKRADLPCGVDSK